MRLPVGWTQEPLSEIGNWVGGGTPSTTNAAFWTGGTIPWVSPKDMKLRQISTAQDSITDAALASSATNLIPERSVLLVTRSGILRRSLPVAINTKPVTLNQDMKALTPIQGVDHVYLYYAFRRFEREILHECCKGGTTVQSIEAPRLMKFAIPVAPLHEQKRIVARIEELFSAVDKGIENLKLARAQLAVYRQALLKHAFEGKLTAGWRAVHADQLESGEQLVSRIRAEMVETSRRRPMEMQDALAANVTHATQAEWVEVALSDITVEGLIGIVRSNAMQNQERRGIRYVKMDRLDMDGNVDVGTNVFVECTEGELERFQLKKGDILFNTRNSLELVGKVGLVRNAPSAPVVFNNNLMRVRVIPSVVPAFLNFQMCAPDFRNRMEKVKKATTSVAAIYGKDLWPLRVVIPSPTEQQVIVDLLDAQLDMVEKMEAEIDANLRKSEALRQSILKKAFAGELVTQDPSDEPAVELLARIRAERASAMSAPKAKTRKLKAARA